MTESISDHIRVYGFDFGNWQLAQEIEMYLRGKGDTKSLVPDRSSGCFNVYYRSPDVAKKVCDELRTKVFTADGSARVTCELEITEADKERMRQMSQVDQVVDSLGDLERQDVLYAFRSFIKAHPEDAAVVLKLHPAVAFGLDKLITPEPDRAK